MRFNEWAKEYERREGKNVEYPYSNSGIKNRLNVRLDAIFNDIKTYEWNHVDNEEKCDSMIETEELPEYKVSIVDGKKFYTEIVTSNQEVES